DRLFFNFGISSSKKSGNGKCSAAYQRESRARGVQASSGQSQKKSADYRKINKRDRSSDPLHGAFAGAGAGVGFCALPTNSGFLPGNSSLNTSALKKIFDGS